MQKTIVGLLCVISGSLFMTAQTTIPNDPYFSNQVTFQHSSGPTAVARRSDHPCQETLVKHVHAQTNQQARRDLLDRLKQRGAICTLGASLPIPLRFQFPKHVHYDPATIPFRHL